MKATLQILLLGATATAAVAQSDPRLSTWYTAKSGEYARIFTTRENEQAGNAVTTWDNGTYAQSQPVYGGVLGVVVLVRVMSGVLRKGERIKLMATGAVLGAVRRFKRTL